MVPIADLWLPILLSALLVFVMSSLVHMVFGYHRTDFQKLPNETRTLDAIRGESIPPGEYLFPCPSSPRDMSSPEMIAKYEKGPVGMLTLRPSGAPSMGKPLVQWFVYCILVGVAVAYLTGRALAPGAAYLEVFRFAGTSAFYAYAFARIADSIWMARAWSTTVKNVFDGLLYALVTAGAFGWLWPR
jgi:hypothetical protein